MLSSIVQIGCYFSPKLELLHIKMKLIDQMEYMLDLLLRIPILIAFINHDKMSFYL